MTEHLNIRPYKEPLEKVEGGFGYLGTLAHTEDGSKVQCHICGELFESLGKHTAKKHKVSAQEYRQRFKLPKRIGLASETERTKMRNLNLAQSSKTKAERVKRIAAYGRDPSKKDRFDKHGGQSLENKNRRGGCYYQLLDKIEALGKKLGKTPTGRDFNKEYGTGFTTSVRLTFGSWNQAVSLAGFTPTRFRGSNVKYSRDMVIAALRNFYEIEGRVPRARDLGDTLPANLVIIRLFGGIVEARRAAGLGQYDYINEGAEL